MKRQTRDGREAPVLMVSYICDEFECSVAGPYERDAYEGPPTCHGTSAVPHGPKFMRALHLVHDVDEIIEVDEIE